MKRILIGTGLVALCAAVAVAQTPKPSPAPTPMLTPPPRATVPPPMLTPAPRATVPPPKKQATPAMPGGLAPAALPTPRFQTQSLTMTNGTAFNAVFDRTSNSFKVDLKDGTYRTTNGGAIRVRGGVIVWDAFGVIERLRKGQGTATAPVGIA